MRLRLVVLASLFVLGGTVNSSAGNKLQHGHADADDGGTLTSSAITASGAKVYNSSAIATNQNAYLTFDSEDFDTDNYHSTSSNTGRLTAPSAGLYIIVGTIQWASNNARNYVSIFLNHSTTIAVAEDRATGTSNANSLNVTVIQRLTAGDYVELFAAQETGGSLNVVSAGNWSPYFSIVRIGN